MAEMLVSALVLTFIARIDETKILEVCRLELLIKGTKRFAVTIAEMLVSALVLTFIAPIEDAKIDDVCRDELLI